MFQVTITNNYTQEVMQADDCTLREALRLVNVARFGACYNDEALSVIILNTETGDFVPGFWED